MDSTNARVVSESAQANLTTTSTVMTFWDRIQATSGDVLGAQFHTGPNVNETAHVFTAAAGNSVASTTGDPGLPIHTSGMHVMDGSPGEPPRRHRPHGD